MSDSPYNFPIQAATVVQKHVASCKNLSLLLDKYIERQVIKRQESEDRSQKLKWLQERLKGQAIESELVGAAYNRWHSAISSLNASFFDARLEWRMVVGLGGETVLETDITLHHIYGIPFIPGSALKGLTRMYVAKEEKDYFVPIEGKADVERKPSMDEKTDHPDIARVFGSQEKAGTVLFFDAFPLKGDANFVIDVMNSHYPDYYKTLKNRTIIDPTNDQPPNPIIFLTVSNTTFTFALAPRDRHDDQHKADVKLAQKWLWTALQNYGVGGKTSAGYGYFKGIHDEEEGSFGSVVEHQMVPMSPPDLRKPTELPTFRIGQEIMGLVISEAQRATALQFIQASDTDKFLLYQDRGMSYRPEDVVILVRSEHLQTSDWKEREQRRCEVLQVEHHREHTVLICKPVQSKFSNKKKRS